MRRQKVNSPVGQCAIMLTEEHSLMRESGFKSREQIPQLREELQTTSQVISYEFFIGLFSTRITRKNYHAIHE